MRYSYEASISGTVEIDEDELRYFTKSEKANFIANRIMEDAYEELDSSIDWERVD